MMGNLATLLADLGDLWPGCARDLTGEVAIGARLATSLYNLRTAAAAENAAGRGQRGHGRGIRRGRLHRRGDEPGSGVRRRRHHEQPDRQLPRVGQDEPGRPVGVPGSPRVGPGRECVRAEAAQHDAGAGHPTVPRPRQHGRPSPSSRTSTATPRCRSPPAPSTVCPSACRSWDATTRTRCCSTSRSSVERHRPWPMVAPGVVGHDATQSPNV